MTKEEYEHERSRLQMVIAAAEQSGNHKQAAARRKKLALLDNEWLLQNLTKRNAVTGDLPKELKVVSVPASDTELVPCDDPVKAFIDFLAMSKNRITIEKAGKKYELVKTDEGVNSCLVCAFAQLCVCIDNGVDEFPCTELSPKSDHHFILIEPCEH